MALFVKKFGGALLKELSSFKKIAYILSDFHQKKHKIIAVVSAPLGLTDSLIKEVKENDFPQNNKAFDLLLSLGEQRSCALLGLALEKIKIPFTIFAGPQVAIKQTKCGNWEIAKKHYLSALKEGIIIVSGFQALDETDQLFVFERGGSDLTALILAHQLKADFCELYKDVAGIFNTDPKKDPLAHSFTNISFNDLEQLIQTGSSIVQLQAAKYAKKNHQNFFVKNLQNQGTFVGNLHLR